MEAELKINIQNQSGQTISVIALENDNLQTLKLLSYAQQRVTITGCDFNFNGRHIDNSTSTLKELRVKDGDTIKLQKRNATPAITFNVPQDENSGEDSFFSDSFGQMEQEDWDFSNQEYELQLEKGFSFAPQLKRQWCMNY